MPGTGEVTSSSPQTQDRQWTAAMHGAAAAPQTESKAETKELPLWARAITTPLEALVIYKTGTIHEANGDIRPVATIANHSATFAAMFLMANASPESAAYALATLAGARAAVSIGGLLMSDVYYLTKDAAARSNALRFAKDTFISSLETAAWAGAVYFMNPYVSFGLMTLNAVKHLCWAGFDGIRLGRR